MTKEQDYFGKNRKINPFEAFSRVSPIAIVSTIGMFRGLGEPDTWHDIVLPGMARAIFQGEYIFHSNADIFLEYLQLGLTPKNRHLFTLPNGKTPRLELGVALDLNGNLTSATFDDRDYVELHKGGKNPFDVRLITFEEIMGSSTPILDFRVVKNPKSAQVPEIFSYTFGTSLEQVVTAHVQYPFDPFRYQN